MRCETHCPKAGGFPVLAAAAVLAVAAVTGVLAAAAPRLLPYAVVAVAVAAAGGGLAVKVLRRSARLAVVTWRPVEREAIRVTLHAEVQAAALRGQPLAIEAPKAAVSGVVYGQATTAPRAG